MKIIDTSTAIIGANHKVVMEVLISTMSPVIYKI
jgi:hypothetical protein